MPKQVKNFVLTIEYDGTDFHGWQAQTNLRTVQGEIEKAISLMTCSQVRISGSGRTDAGVHARGQVASFLCTTRLDAKTILSGLNSLLPYDIVILNCKKTQPDFHARFDARDKTYEYKILNRPLRSAISLRYCWHIRKPLDTASMHEALCLLKGTHDFSGFENTGSQRAHPVRTIFEAKILKADDRVDISLTANGFLRCMVRNIVGTLVEVGLGKRTISGFAEILEKRDRSRAGATAPARGLFLVNVRYNRTAYPASSSSTPTTTL